MMKKGRRNELLLVYVYVSKGNQIRIANDKSTNTDLPVRIVDRFSARLDIVLSMRSSASKVIISISSADILSAVHRDC